MSRKIFWNERRVRQLREYARAKKSSPEIATIMGVTKGAVTWQCSKHGIKLVSVGSHFSKEQDDTIKRMVAEGCGWSQITDALGMTNQGKVRKHGYSLGLRLLDGRPGGANRTAKPRTHKKRKCLMHGGEFTPSHRHEFVCTSCKQTRSWRESQVQLI